MSALVIPVIIVKVYVAHRSSFMVLTPCLCLCMCVCAGGGGVSFVKYDEYDEI